MASKFRKISSVILNNVVWSSKTFETTEALTPEKRWIKPTLDLIVAPLPADGLAPLGARPSAVRVMTKFFFSNTYGTTAIILCMGLVNERWRYNKVVSHWLTYTEWSPEPSLQRQALITKSRRGIHNFLSVFLHHPFDSMSLVSKSLLKFYALINCPS